MLIWHSQRLFWFCLPCLQYGPNPFHFWEGIAIDLALEHTKRTKSYSSNYQRNIKTPKNIQEAFEKNEDRFFHFFCSFLQFLAILAVLKLFQ